MSSRLRRMNCVWSAGGLIGGAATPLIYSSISHWSPPSDTGYQIHLHPLRDEEFETDGICIQTPWLYSHSIFPAALSPFFSPHVATPQSWGCNAPTLPPSSSSSSSPLPLFTPVSRLACLLPRCASLSRSISGGVLVSDGVLVDPASGPVVCVCGGGCFFPVPHITDRALALCTLQEFGLAEYQALTSSSPVFPSASNSQMSYLNLTWKMHGITRMFINLFKVMCVFRSLFWVHPGWSKACLYWLF